MGGSRSGVLATATAALAMPSTAGSTPENISSAENADRGGVLTSEITGYDDCTGHCLQCGPRTTSEQIPSRTEGASR